MKNVSFIITSVLFPRTGSFSSIRPLLPIVFILLPTHPLFRVFHPSFLAIFLLISIISTSLLPFRLVPPVVLIFAVIISKPIPLLVIPLIRFLRLIILLILLTPLNSFWLLQTFQITCVYYSLLSIHTRFLLVLMVIFFNLTYSHNR